MVDPLGKTMRASNFAVAGSRPASFDGRRATYSGRGGGSVAKSLGS